MVAIELGENAGIENYSLDPLEPIRGVISKLDCTFVTCKYADQELSARDK